MGTGGPSRQSTPTIQFAASLDSFNIIPQLFENYKPFFKIFRKNFAAKAAGPEKRLSQIVLNRASATRGFLKLTKSRAHLSYTPSQSPRTDSWRFTPGKASGSERPATCPPQAQKNHLFAQVVSACRETGTCIKREPVFSYIWARSRGRQRKKQCPSTAIWPAFSDSWQQI